MKRTNILLITSDQQHYTAMQSVNPKLATQSIQRLVDGGMQFDRAYCANPTCTPSRSTIITGMYPSQHGAWSLGTKLFETVPTIGDTLTGAGYRTALVGKAHFQQLKSTDEFPSLESRPKMFDLKFWRDFHGPFYGFQHVELLRNHTTEGHVGQHYACWMEDKGFKEWRRHFTLPGGSSVTLPYVGRWTIPEEFHYNAFIAEKTNEQLEEYKKEDVPFFLWASFPDPHNPQVAPSPWYKLYKPKDMKVPRFDKRDYDDTSPYYAELKKFKPNFAPYMETGFGVHGLNRQRESIRHIKRRVAVYQGMVSFMDKYIGKILDKLDELGLADDTIVVFTTDHGDMLGQHGIHCKCIAHYEDLLRVPFVVRYGKNVPSGRRTDALFSLVDLAPTLLSMLGLEVPEYMTGVNQSAVWKGETDSIRENVVVENRHEPNVMNIRSYIEKDYKLTVHYGSSQGELYNLKSDYDEHHSLWSDMKMQETKRHLLERFIVAENEKRPVAERHSKAELEELFAKERNDLLLQFIFEDMKKEPMPMPRVTHA